MNEWLIISLWFAAPPWTIFNTMIVKLYIRILFAYVVSTVIVNFRMRREKVYAHDLLKITSSYCHRIEIRGREISMRDS
jgi:hypothetical protein